MQNNIKEILPIKFIFITTFLDLLNVINSLNKIYIIMYWIYRFFPISMISSMWVLNSQIKRIYNSENTHAFLENKLHQQKLMQFSIDTLYDRYFNFNFIQRYRQWYRNATFTSKFSDINLCCIP